MNTFIFPPSIREAIVRAIPAESSIANVMPEIGYTYFPHTHARALHIDSSLVEGIRGSGKSFWYQTLQDNSRRKITAKAFPDSGITEKMIVCTGFGEKTESPDYPVKDILEVLARESPDTRRIWKTIVLRQFEKIPGYSFPDFPTTSWLERLQWVIQNPESVNAMISQAHHLLDKADNKMLILFDALDRSAPTWHIMNNLVRGLLETLLEFKTSFHIKLKAFVRPDHLEPPEVTSFVDSSKLLNHIVSLRWPALELYGLFYQHLANEPQTGKQFRIDCARVLKESWQENAGIWIIPNALRLQTETQRDFFHLMTGPYMGKDPRRGYPYTWLVNHLGDGSAQVSPRSFLQALREAADDTTIRQYEYPLHYESIKKGVQKASGIRVREMKEDYPWVDTCVQPLAGLTVPCDFSAIAERWKEENIIERLKKDVDNHAVRLPPAHLDEGHEGLCKDLITLRIFEKTRNDRINLPDVYRVGYGLGRKGGVKPSAQK